MTRGTKPAFLAITPLLVACGVLLALRNSHPMLVEVYEGTGTQPAFAILNPFRDRSSERAAESFLRQVSSGKCRALVEPLRGEYAAHICASEGEHPGLDFSLQTREREPEAGVRLLYRVRRKNSPDSTTWIKLQKNAEGWQVVDFEPIY